MDHDVWAITACLQFKDGELLDKQKPFKTYYIEAPTAKKAIRSLVEEYPMCNAIIHTMPTHSIVTEAEYENN